MMLWITVTALLALATWAMFELSVKTSAFSLMCVSVFLFFATVVACWVTADIASAAPAMHGASAAIPPDPRTLPREVHYGYVRLRDVFAWGAAILGVSGSMMFGLGAFGRGAKHWETLVTWGGVLILLALVAWWTSSRV